MLLRLLDFFPKKTLLNGAALTLDNTKILGPIERFSMSVLNNFQYVMYKNTRVQE